ncbi:MAG: septum formation initiator family protein [Armatimonadota bacterium]
MSRTRSSQSPPSKTTSLGYSLRAVVLVLALVGIAGILSYAAFAVTNPIFKIQQSARETADKRAQVETLRQQKKDLEGKIAWMSSPGGTEELGRKRGYARAGEDAVRFEPIAPAAAAAPDQKPLVTAANASIVDGIGVGVVLFMMTFIVVAVALRRRRREALEVRPVNTLTPRSKLRRRK